MEGPSVGVCSEKIRSTINALQGKHAGFEEASNTNTLGLRWMAEAMEKENKNQHVAALENATLELIALANEMQHHSAALNELKASYVFTNEPTKFEEMLQERTLQRVAESADAPENNPIFQQFKAAVWNVHHKGQPMPGQEDEDIVMTTGQFGILNATCPISGKSVIELNSPVRSAGCRHVYDKESAMHYIRQGPKSCAVAGCRTILKSNELLCDGTLKMELLELQKRSDPQQAGQHFTELDEDDS